MNFDVKDDLEYFQGERKDKDLTAHDYNLRQIKFEFINFDRECVYDCEESAKMRELMVKTISLSSVLLEELKFYKNTLCLKEIQLDSANNENYELSEECNRMYESLTELIEKNRKNEISIRESLEQREQKVDLISELAKLNDVVKELQKNIKIIEIERDEAFYRSEELQQNLDSHVNNCKTSNRIVKDLERKLEILIRKNEESEKKISSYMKVNSDEKLNLSECSQKLNYLNATSHNLYTESTKFSSINSMENNNRTNHLSCENLSKNHHTRSLSTLLPDIFEDETDDCFDFRISLTSNEVVRKMSDRMINPKLKNKSLSTSNFVEEIGILNKAKNDIYKDFFLLTFQSLKLNSKNIESFYSINPDLLYGEIIQSNIPFHEFSEFILKHIEKNKKYSFFGNFKQIFDIVDKI